MPNWKSLVGFDGLYRISDDGQVWSERRQRLLSTKPNKYRGYAEFCVVDDQGKQHTKSVHQEVMKAFVGPLPPGEQVRHLDGNPLNNRLDNLVYGTPVQNQQDRRGENYQGSRRLTNAQIAIINEKIKMGTTAAKLQDEYKITYNILMSIIDDKKPKEARYELIYKCIVAGVGIEKVAKHFDMSARGVGRVMESYGGIRNLRKKYPINRSLSENHIANIIKT